MINFPWRSSSLTSHAPQSTQLNQTADGVGSMTYIIVIVMDIDLEESYCEEMSDLNWTGSAVQACIFELKAKSMHQEVTKIQFPTKS